MAVGRDDWTFFGSDNGGNTAAVLRSFVASCQRNEVDPFSWLKDVLSRIAKHPVARSPIPASQPGIRSGVIPDSLKYCFPAPAPTS